MELQKHEPSKRQKRSDSQANETQHHRLERNATNVSDHFPADDLQRKVSIYDPQYTGNLPVYRGFNPDRDDDIISDR